MEIKEVTTESFPEEDWPEMDCKMTVDEWVNCCEDGVFVDDDGYAEVFGEENGSEFSIGFYYPSQTDILPANACFVMWYNK